MVHNLHIYLVAHLPSYECVLDLHDLNGAINNEDMAALISVSHEHLYKNVKSTRSLSSKIEWQCSTHNGKMQSCQILSQLFYWAGFQRSHNSQETLPYG